MPLYFKSLLGVVETNLLKNWIRCCKGVRCEDLSETDSKEMEACGSYGSAVRSLSGRESTAGCSQ